MICNCKEGLKHLICMSTTCNWISYTLYRSLSQTLITSTKSWMKTSQNWAKFDKDCMHSSKCKILQLTQKSFDIIQKLQVEFHCGALLAYSLDMWTVNDLYFARILVIKNIEIHYVLTFHWILKGFLFQEFDQPGYFWRTLKALRIIIMKTL